MSQSVKPLTSAQVMISWFTSSIPASASVLTARSPETASHSVSPSLPVPSLLTLCFSLSLSLSEINIKKRRSIINIQAISSSQSPPQRPGPGICPLSQPLSHFLMAFSSPAISFHPFLLCCRKPLCFCEENLHQTRDLQRTLLLSASLLQGVTFPLKGHFSGRLGGSVG